MLRSEGALLALWKIVKYLNLSSINNKKHSHQKTPYIRRFSEVLTG